MFTALMSKFENNMLKYIKGVNNAVKVHKKI